jgi:hypothetical protein
MDIEKLISFIKPLNIEKDENVEYCFAMRETLYRKCAACNYKKKEIK